MNENLIKNLRVKIKGYLENSNYESAMFWADKAVTLSKFKPEDVYMLVQAMFELKQYERAAKLIENKGLHKQYFIFRHVAAKSYFAAKNMKSALAFLGDDTSSMALPFSISNPVSKNVVGIPDDEEMVASMHLLKGDIYRALEVKDIASECYREALKTDLYCFEAFSRLVDNHLLTASEEQELLNSLHFEEHCKTKEEIELVKFMYSMRLKKYNKPDRFEVPEILDGLHNNLDVATSLGERHYYNGELKTSFEITQMVMNIDPFHPLCLPLHIALLVQLKKPNKLFFLAHQLVEMYPDLAISWYAVGCFYLMQKGKQDLARRYLEKATLVDNLYGPAFLAYGHSFANGNEHDQAMAAYFKATSLMPGCHLPFLYIGLEYSNTNNPKLAESFFRTALIISPKDPHVLHELGVTCYVREDYPKALSFFNAALREVEQLGSEKTDSEWEPLLNNLGHVHRKLKRYITSLDYHKEALSLAPNSAQTYSAVALAYCYVGHFNLAIEHLHKSLSLCNDNTFASSLLENVLDQYCKDEVPEYYPPLQHTTPSTSTQHGKKLTKTSSRHGEQDVGGSGDTSSLITSKPSSRMRTRSTADSPHNPQATSTPFERLVSPSDDASIRFSEEDMELDSTL